jgi:hypothetical protein
MGHQSRYIPPSGGTATLSRATRAITQTIAAGTDAQVSITLAKTYLLQRVTITHAAWVRLYRDTASRAVDAGRLITTAPAPGSGVVAEFSFDSGGTVLCSPQAIGSADTNSIPIAIKNTDIVSRTITLTIDYLAIEP